ncbi:penicillin-binding protein 2 [Candidatus Saccharibacteria bacterium]|nr:penicillin-binding protein 2 [Candidatus Saccharibacteria bacterium]
MRMGLAFFALVLLGRLFYLQVIKHASYARQASNEHTRKDALPATRGELFVHDGSGGISPIALNQTLNVLSADPRFVKDQPATAQKLAAITGGSAAAYEKSMASATEYAKLADRIPNDQAAKIKALGLTGIWLVAQDYRTYPEGSLAAQTLGFVNADGTGQYGIEQYLNPELTGTPGQLSGKTDTNGVPIYTSGNIDKQPIDGKSYVLTIDRNVQAEVEQALADRVKAVNAKSGSAVVLDPNTGAVIAMATYPTFDPNHYANVSNYGVFLNQVVDGQFEPGSGLKVFTMAAGLDQGKVTPDTTYNDPHCYTIDTRQVCDAATDLPGPNRSMTVVLRDSLNTGVMFVLRSLGGDPNKFTLAGKKTLYDYFTNHFGFGTSTGIEQANEVPGIVNLPSNAAGNDVNYANMSFGQGIDVTMIQMVAAMGAIANGGKLWQPHLVDAVMNDDGTQSRIAPKLEKDHVISAAADAQLNQMLQVVAKHGSGYIADAMNPNYSIAGKTGTAQIPKSDGTGYIDGANIGSFIGYAPATNPKFVLMVRINEPDVTGYAETTTVPLFGQICTWLFNYYGIAPTGQIK